MHFLNAIFQIEEAKAAIRLALKRELRGKVPLSELDKLLKEVIEQAEGQYGDWPMAGWNSRCCSE